MKKKEDIILKKGDKVCYKNVFGNYNTIIVSGYDGFSVKDFEEDGSKIINIERTETIYKATKEILDKEEKEYLEAVLRPFRNRVNCIVKNTSCFDGEQYISIELLNRENIYLPYFTKNTKYKGMEPDKEYTLVQLGLFEGESK